MPDSCKPSVLLLEWVILIGLLIIENDDIGFDGLSTSNFELAVSFSSAVLRALFRGEDPHTLSLTQAQSAESRFWHFGGGLELRLRGGISFVNSK